MHLPCKAALVSLQHGEFHPRHLIGGKACSLQEIRAAGLPVPPAWVLTTDFFQPWFDAVARGAQPPSQPSELPLDARQRLALDDLFAQLAAAGPAQRYAVRSSAPEEDGMGASFAGVYHTELGICADALEPAIRRCFAASLDPRVAAYREAHAMAPGGLALIVQLQLDSEVAGVGFSIDPHSNDFDTAAMAANWGLGESVVAGMASPDHYTVDKTSGAVLTRERGAKQLYVTLAEGGGTATAAPSRPDAYCLDDGRLRQLCSAICTMEAHLGHPVDVEWAFFDGSLYLLQARPVTAWVPLPEAMQSAPGARRTLYMDIALSKGMTTNDPISPIALDWLAGDMRMLAQGAGAAGLDTASPAGLIYLGGGRMYMNLSNLLWFVSPAQLARSNAPTDQRMADTLAGIDAAGYRASERPRWIWPALRVLPAVLWQLRRPVWRALRSVLAPVSTHRLYQRQSAAFERRYRAGFDNTLPLAAFRQRYGAPAFAHIIDVDMPALGVGVLAQALVQRLVRKGDAEQQALAEQLGRGIGGNLVVDMGVRIYQISKLLEAGAFDDMAALCDRLVQRQLPPPFLAAWDDFMARYGCRGPGEMDLANAHYADDPMIVLRQMAATAGSGAAFDPAAVQAELAGQRQRAYVELSRRFGWWRRALLRRACTLVDCFGGTRDTPKQHMLMYQHAVRARLLAEGSALAAAGRLDRADQIMNLTLADIGAAAGDPACDLRRIGAQRTAFGARLRRHVRTFPAVIDSRGRILRPPPRPGRPGEQRAMAVSPGVARGPVKVLRSAHDKTVERGDILVAYTTDPGWTPLFINAAGIVLEVGGLLQHGAVVAREFGKPCVAGVADVLSRFTDGQLVEVDGTSGVVRILTQAAHCQTHEFLN
ncbi:hypothetical protein KY495_20065 [Massilia sp. PAMC28688]|uniref:PEP/pyruvate-binding domain-containing protein n=1 Tax=Massilia sp. PAMC28688 TaxID=2861283 RepID=UPI001C6336D0|nr:PEP/pyruvate-binding domain-containing protein [Massilia sp. PAMC28688]QYF92977.1 hypothetical protein KY495_20065 [Massilia sp. PAMC28688]